MKKENGREKKGVKPSLKIFIEDDKLLNTEYDHL